VTVAIKFENISKLYRLGEIGTGTLAHDLHRAWAKLRGKPDPFANVGQVNDRTQSPPNSSRLAPSSSYVWTLKDINFEVQQGEILGIIGRNGAGKSTLLKLLSRVTAPTTGSIKSRGRIASLLEVGTGFHPELTGRENVYLNGAILGMRRHEITKRLEEIVEFSGCAKYIDTPVKRYSSGMMVRLGFAVAAHLDCEILVVDEVLAVGDAEFQKKCIGKMSSVSRESGRTILFVSHNLAAVRHLCTSGIVLTRGNLAMTGTAREAVDYYYDENWQFAKNVKPTIQSDILYWSKNDGESTGLAFCGEQYNFLIKYSLKHPVHEPEFGIRIFSADGTKVTTLVSNLQHQELPLEISGSGEVTCAVKNVSLMPGTYTIQLVLFQPGQLICENLFAGQLTVEMSENAKDAIPSKARWSHDYGLLYQDAHWHTKNPSENTH
jgi:lipopolysaccharide transport system ATP-binding protein